MKTDTQSFWNKTCDKELYPGLRENLNTDILIIGGGITGITCAYCLAKLGAKPVLIEEGGLCDGTTGNTTGKVTLQHGIIYRNIVKKHGMDFARLYAESQQRALDFVRERVKELEIDCQLTGCSSYVYAQTEAELEQVIDEFNIARELGIDAEFLPVPDFPPENSGMLCFKHQAAFHPVRYVDKLAKAAVSCGATIYCQTKAVRLADGDMNTVLCESDGSGFMIRANHLVMATQYPFYDGPNLFYTRLYANRSYGIAVDPKREWPEGNYINIGDPSRSIRTHLENGKRILIVVGENHFPGRGEKDMGVHFDRLIKYANEIAGVNKVLATWSAQDYDTPDQLPYICRISEEENIYAASGYGKWGLTNGTLAGMLLSELILKGGSPYEKVYSRKRGDYSSSLGKTIAEVLTPVGELIKSKFEGAESREDLQPGEGRVINFKGHRAGIYRDYDDTVTILDISCTHLSTELNFNSAEKTWDCPAHGGRFSTDGKLLEGPPKDPLKTYFKGKYSELDRDE